MRWRKDQQRISAQETTSIKELSWDILFCVIPEMNWLLRSNYVNSQHQAYLKLNMVEPNGKQLRFSFRILNESNNWMVSPDRLNET